MTTYFSVPLYGISPNPFVGNTAGDTGSTFIPGAWQGSQITINQVPANTQTPSFSPTLDGNPYTINVVWNLFGQRYYCNCYDSSNSLVFTTALIHTDQSLANETLSWDPNALEVTVTTSTPHGYKIGTVVSLTIENVSPSGYNGTFPCYIDGPSTFQYTMSVYPGPVSSAGQVAYYFNICGGYFSSTLIYRNEQFEVNP